MYMIMLENFQNNISMYGCSSIQDFLKFLFKFNEGRHPAPLLAKTYEAQMTEMTSSLDGQDREDFIAHYLNMRAMERSIFRYSLSA